MYLREMKKYRERERKREKERERERERERGACVALLRDTGRVFA